MDEVYFCIVLHKDEDRRHFLFCELLLQTLENQYSLLCNKGKIFEMYLKNALYRLHTFFFATFSDARMPLILCIIGNFMYRRFCQEGRLQSDNTVLCIDFSHCT